MLRKFKCSSAIRYFNALLFYCIIQAHYSHAAREGTDNPKDSSELPTVLWWTPFTGETGSVRTCGGKFKCLFTEDRNELTKPSTKVILFYGSNFDPGDVPLPRGSRQQWGLLHEESPKNNPLLCSEEALNLFNFTATWSRNSSFPLTFLSLNSLKDITDKTYYVPVAKKNRFKKEENLAAVVYAQSSCDAPSERDSYVAELMKWIPVDSYGKCLNNKMLPVHLQDPAESMESPEFLKLMAKYKFTLAFENAVGDDYITEKLWRTLQLGSVPVYYGSPSVQDWLPNNQSAILVTAATPPEKLADFLRSLDADDASYVTFLTHKSQQRTDNLKLISAMEERTWGNELDQENFVEAYECFVCQQVHHLISLEGQGFSQKPAFADTSHYHCSLPINPVTGVENEQSWWTDHWRKTAVEGRVLKQFALRNEPFTSEEFHQKIRRTLPASMYLTVPPRNSHLRPFQA